MSKLKQPPVGTTLAQEADIFMKGRKNTTEKVKESGISPIRSQVAASALAGLLSSGGRARAEELVEEAFRYADLILAYKK